MGHLFFGYNIKFLIEYTFLQQAECYSSGAECYSSPDEVSSPDFNSGASHDISSPEHSRMSESLNSLEEKSPTSPEHSHIHVSETFYNLFIQRHLVGLFVYAYKEQTTQNLTRLVKI